MPPAPTPGGIDLTTATPQQLQAYANAQASAETKASESPLVTEQQQTAAQYAAQGKAIQGFATALAQLLGGIGPADQQAYQGAADSQAAFGKGFSSQLQGVVNQSQDQNNQFLSSMGAPSGALKTAPDVGDISYALGGYIPASTFGREGAAWTAAANQLPASAAAQGMQDFAGNTYAGNQASQKIVDQIATIAAKQPTIAQSALSSLESNQAKQQTVEITARKNAVDEITKYGVDPQTGQLTPQASAQLEQLTGAPAGTFTGMDAATAATIADHAQSVAVQQASLAERTRHDQVTESTAQDKVNLSYITAAQKAKNGGAKLPTADEIWREIGAWQQGKAVTERVKDKNPDSNGNPVYRTVTKYQGKVGYQQAYNRLKTSLTLGGMNPKDADANARAYLDTSYPKGQNGRGWLTNEERAALTKAGVQNFVGKYQGHPYIATTQAAALQKAGLLPPGEKGLINGKQVYYIAPGY